MKIEEAWLVNPNKLPSRLVGVEMVATTWGIHLVEANVYVPWAQVREFRALNEEKPPKRKPGRPRKVDEANKKTTPRARRARKAPASSK